MGRVVFNIIGYCRVINGNIPEVFRYVDRIKMVFLPTITHLIAPLRVVVKRKEKKKVYLICILIKLRITTIQSRDACLFYTFFFLYKTNTFPFYESIFLYFNNTSIKYEYKYFNCDYSFFFCFGP